MKKILSLILACILMLSIIPASASSQDTISDFSCDLARMKKNGLYGFIDKSGNWVVEPVYSYANDFSEGFALVQQKGKRLMIDTEGNIVGSGLDYLGSVREGLICAKHNSYPNTYHTYEKMSPDAIIPVLPEGKVIKSSENFSDGLAYVCINLFQDDACQAFIDHQGETQIVFDEAWCQWSSSARFSPTIYAEVVNGCLFLDGYAVIAGDIYNLAGSKTLGRAQFIIDKAGNKLYVHEGEDNIINMGNGIFRICYAKSNIFSFIDATGTPLTDERYTLWYKDSRNVLDYLPSDGIAAVGVDRKGTIKPCFINLNTNEMLPSDSWEDITAFSEGMAAVKKDGKWGYINTSGEYVLEPQYDLARPFSCGVAIVDLGDEWFIIDPQGNILY